MPSNYLTRNPNMLTNREKALILLALYGDKTPWAVTCLMYFAKCGKSQANKYFDELVLPFIMEVRAVSMGEITKPHPPHMLDPDGNFTSFENILNMEGELSD